MAHSILLTGGPPWGLRISTDQESRPVVANLLPGGRASVSGVKIGDIIESINSYPISSTTEAQEKIHDAHGQLLLNVSREPGNYHSTIAREKLSSSVHNSPIFERKKMEPALSVPSSPMLPRTNPNFRSPVRQVRLDHEGIRGATENKRRLFEQLGAYRPSATDHLLQRKIQFGPQPGVPSESTTGYGSVGGDFAGYAESSSRASPISSVAQGDLDDAASQGGEQRDKIADDQRAFNMNPEMMVASSPGPSQWTMQTETPNAQPAQGQIESPMRRSVAALRQAITDKLEMKTPLGRVTPSQEGRRTPSWTTSVKVFEGIDDNRPYLGRVLDGPVPEHKYFQGVPPPSYNYVPNTHSPNAPQNYAEVSLSKPPIPPATPPKPAPKENARNSFLNSVAAKEKEEVEKEEVVTEQNDGITASDYYHQLYSGGTERETRQIPLEQDAGPAKPPLYRGYGEKSFDSVFKLNGGEDGTSVYSSSTINDPRLEKDEMSNSYVTSYSEDPLTASTTSTAVIHPSSSSDYPEDPKSSPVGLPFRRTSMDLESSQLLKAKSPSPYSSQTFDHYATMRRSHNTVNPRLNETSSSSEHISSPPAQKTFSYSTSTNDSGLGDVNGNTKDIYSYDTFVPSSTASSDRPADTFSDSRPERPDSLLSCSTLDGSAHAAEPTAQPVSATAAALDASSATAPAPYRPVSNEPEMSSWYKDMYKKMHKLENGNESILRHQLRDHSPTPSTISRPLTPTSSVIRPPSRFECEITPRRAKSVGRIVEPASPNRFALERQRTIHFHLPSYKFRHEDERPIICGCAAGGACMRCGRPRRELTFNEVDFIYKTLGREGMKKEREAERIQRRVAHRAMTDRLDSTAAELEKFIRSLDLCWQRSSSTPMLNKREKEDSPSIIADEIAELKRISKEELMYRNKAERLSEELQQQRQRRHGYIPTAAPSLQKNFDRFEGLMNDYGKESSPASSLRRGQTDSPMSVGSAVRTATAVYKFTAKSARELPLNKGDIVRIHREIDCNWLEGERNGRVGIFPINYVQINSETDNKNKMRAVYPFTARNDNEMHLKLGEIVTYRRDIDANWVEGSNHLGEIGIFPKCYVRPIDDEPQEEEERVIPNRPKTPKIESAPLAPAENSATFDIEYESPPREIRPSSNVPRDAREVRENGYRENYEEKRDFLSEMRETVNLAPSSHARSEPPQPISTAQPQQQPSSRVTFPWNGGSLASLVPKGSETFRAVFPYRPEKEDELELFVDDIIFVVEKCDDGWFIGTSLRTGQFGTFPGNYVQRH